MRSMSDPTSNLTADPKDVMAALALADQRRRARLELDEKIIQGLQGPFLTEDEWRSELEKMRSSIPESAPNRGTT